MTIVVRSKTTVTINRWTNSTTTPRGGPIYRRSPKTANEPKKNGNSFPSNTSTNAIAVANNNARTNQSRFQKAVPTFKEFLHQQSVKSQYRSFLRTIHRSIRNDEGQKLALLRDVKKAYGDNSKLTWGEDSLALSMAVKEGDRKLKELKSMVGYDDTNPYTTNNDATTKKPQEDSASWLSIQDKDDPRGRIGVEWPWERTSD